MTAQALVVRCRQGEEAERALAELYELGTAGVTERDEPGGWVKLEAFFDVRFDVAAAAAPGLAGFEMQWREHRDPRETWQEPFEPLAVGKRLYLVPALRDEPAPPGRLRLTVHARQASGSGYQPATQLALIALEGRLEARAGRAVSFLDVGTGSGILCAAAALLSPESRRFGCDLDPVALAEARENGAPAALFAGSARAVAASSADLVAANLNAESILSLAADLARVVKPDGHLILSGFTERNSARVRAALAGFGLELLETLASDRWRAAVFARPPLSP